MFRMPKLLSVRNIGHYVRGGVSAVAEDNREPVQETVCGQPWNLVKFASSQRPVLIVVVDTEEEFDWSAGHSRNATSVTAMAEIIRFQRVCDEFEICPTYVVDYPVASQADGVAPLKEFYHSGRAEIGAHLHPWVSPPFDERLTVYNSYPGNLPPEIEAAKLRTLSEVTALAFGTRPVIYKAGRYGIGPNTSEILLEQGYEIDLSAAPPMDYRSDGGPDFSTHPAEPYWIGAGGRLLGIPSAGAFVGLIQNGAHHYYRFATSPILNRVHMPGILTRLGLLERLRLSPEGYSLDDNRRLTRALYRRGKRVFTYSLHSPSMKPGCTPYVASELERDRLLVQCRQFFDWFLHELGGISMTPLELKRSIQG